MPETRFRDLILGDVILSFDGQVVELFGSTPVAERIHRLMLAMQVSGPTERGNYVVDLSRTAGGGGVQLSIVGADWPNVEPVIAEISATFQQPGG